MKTFFVIALFSITMIANKIAAQKPSLKYDSYKNWPDVKFLNLSNDGKFVVYQVGNQTSGFETFIRSTEGNYIEKRIGNPTIEISNDSRRAFLQYGDTLEILILGTKNKNYIQNVNNFKTGVNGSFAYTLKDTAETFKVRLKDGKSERVITDVKDYQYLVGGNSMLLIREERNSKKYEISILDLKSGSIKTIWRGLTRPVDFCYYKNYPKFIFFEKKESAKDSSLTDLYYYDGSALIAERKLTDNALHDLGRLFISSEAASFTQDGEKIMFSCGNHDSKEIYNKNQGDIKSDVEIWSYRDPFLYSEQQNTFPEKRMKWSFNLITGKLVKLYTYDASGFSSHTEVNNDFIMIKNQVEGNEYTWNKSNRLRYELININDGTHTVILDSLLNFDVYVAASPGGKYIMYFDPTKRNFIVYDIARKIKNNITSQIPVPVYDDSYETGAPFRLRQFGTPIWLEGDEGVLVSDQYDIWQVGLSQGRKTYNITNGYGRKNKIKFYPAIDNQLLVSKEPIILSAFNTETKENGFYKAKLNSFRDPELLTMAPAVFKPNTDAKLQYSIWDYYDYSIYKAKESARYVLYKMDVNHAPNLFATNDFKTFSSITDLQFQRQFNWMNAELVKYKVDSTELSGILYRPENFNPSQKYPIIFYIYERLSDGFNLFIKPNSRPGDLGIAYFVSNGYLVFLPDIQFNVGHPGNSILTSVQSAVNTLSSRPFINTAKMGIQGISFGGFGVNYVITHSDLFAAAASSSGVTNFVSGYGELYNSSFSTQVIYEVGQNRIGRSLWASPDLYIENSPVFNADKTVTPLLLMQNKKDQAVSWGQGLQFFTGLRRLEKKVWMLQYNKGGHGIYNEDADDYSIRLAQFFNHYLKDFPPGKWMTTSISPLEKNIDDGLQLSTAGIEP